MKLQASSATEERRRQAQVARLHDAAAVCLLFLFCVSKLLLQSATQAVLPVSNNFAKTLKAQEREALRLSSQQQQENILVRIGIAELQSLALVEIGAHLWQELQTF